MPTTRRIGLIGATGIGIGAMLGAGVFSDLWVSLLDLGWWMVAALGLAAAVAAANALSTAQLAARHPVAGGAYAYGTAELGAGWGRLAGIGFVMGKTVSVAVAATVFGSYLLPAYAPWVATAAIVVAWALNARGITRTATGATVIAAVVAAVLGALAVAALATGPMPGEGFASGAGGAATPWSFLAAAAATFFAFAGYARIATLGEEVTAPARTIPRAIVIALAVVVALYVLVGLALSATGIGDEAAPLTSLAPGASWIVAPVAALATFGAMLAVMAGVGRTAMAMARESDLPRLLARQQRSEVPVLAEAVAALAAIALVWTPGVTLLLASAAAVLTYYVVANLAAIAQRRAGRTATLRVPVAVSAFGLAGSAVLAVTAVVAGFESWVGSAVFLAIALVWWAVREIARRSPRS